MKANLPEVEFPGTLSKFRKRNKMLLLLVYVIHLTRNLASSRRSRAKKAKKCTKKCDARAKLFSLRSRRGRVFARYRAAGSGWRVARAVRRVAGGEALIISTDSFSCRLDKKNFSVG